MPQNTPFQLKTLPEDAEMFQFLHGSDIGRMLCRYLERLGDALCDSRTLENDIATPEGQVEFKGRRLAAETIQENLYRPIRQRDDKTDRKPKKGYR